MGVVLPRLALPAIADSRPLRLSLFFLLYGSQGVLVGLFWFAVPGWLAANGASAADVGMAVGAASLPWSLKFLNGSLVDRYAYLPMGRRRAWLIFGQASAVLGLAVLAFLNPQVSDLALLSGAALLLNTFINFQDVATDGMAVDLVPESERARANGLMFGGQALGLAAATSLGGILLADYGMRAAALACGAYILLVLLLVLGSREHRGERLLPWTEGEATAAALAVHAETWGHLLKTFFAAIWQRQCLLLALAGFLSGAAVGVALGVMPLLATQQAGMSQASYSALTGTGNLVGAVLGLVVFGVVTDMVGPLRMHRLGMAMLCLACFALLLAQPLWGSPWPITLFLMFILSARVMLNVSGVSLAMGLCHSSVAATLMTFFGTMPNIGVTLASQLLGPVDKLGGHPALVGLMLGFALLALGAVLLLRQPAGSSPGAAAMRDLGPVEALP